MPKSVTPWSNNNNKNASSWARLTKNSSAWGNNITKNATRFTQATKNSSAWAQTNITAVPYLYDDPTRLWADTPAIGYDYLTPITNTINNKVPTAWSAT